MSSLPELTVMFQRYGIALALGLIIGVEREKEKSEAFAGIRTFPLISLLGCTAAMVQEMFASWAFPVAFLSLAAIVVTAHMYTPAGRRGITTEIATLLCFFFGALVWWQLTVLAAALGVITVLLLATKKPLEDISHRIGSQDIAAALQFGIITLIVLPVLPDRTMGPLDVLNPRTVWLMVVLIAGINFVGYVLIKLLGARQGIGLAGLLGGIASSTAVTLGFSRRSRKEPAFAPELAVGIVLASTVMFVRVFIEAFTVNARVGKLLLAPLCSAVAVGLLCSALIWFGNRRRTPGPGRREQEDIKAENPFELWPAILFGLLFGAILFAAKAAQMFFGTTGIYLSSVITGFADVDPITLSLSNLAGDTITSPVAARGIALAALSNTGVKMLITCTAGPVLLRYSLPVFSGMIIVGLIVTFTVV